MGGRGSSGGGGSRASLPALQGSERQVSWANDIRDTAYAQLDAMDRTLDRMEQQARQTSWVSTAAQARREAEDLAGFSRQSVRTVRAEVNDTLSGITSASAIINNRERLTASRIRSLVELEERTGQVSAARRRRRS